VLTISNAADRQKWNSFLASQKFRPFLQSWEMGEVYREIGQEPIRLEVREDNALVSICFGHIVPARRGKHLSIPYGPAVSFQVSGVRCQEIFQPLMIELQRIAKDAGCAFIRMSPFWPKEFSYNLLPTPYNLRPSPLHLLAEHLWYLPLVTPDPWECPMINDQFPMNVQLPISKVQERSGEDIFKEMRATTRNLIRRAEKEGVTITISDNPIRDLPLFLTLHDETRHRHRFTPYTDAFFHAQVKHFVHPTTYSLQPTSSCSLYLAHYKNEVIAASIHMHFAGETSYHHGASSKKYRNIPASYLLQWRAIQDAIARGDHIYNFWGIAPLSRDEQAIFLQEKQPKRLWGIPLSPCKKTPCTSRHPFAGVTTFKTGFGGKSIDLVHCIDLPLKPTYYLTRGFETARKWWRGF